MGMFSSTLSAREMALLCHRLAALFDSGVPVARALKAVEESSGSRGVRAVARDMRQDIEGGATLGQAVEAQRTYFPALFVHMVHVAEQSGGLGVVLSQLEGYFDDLRRLYNGVIRQVAYPAALLAAIFVGIPILKAFLSDVAGISAASFETQLFWILRNLVLTAGGVLITVAVIARITFRFTTRESILMYCWPLAGTVRRLLLARFAWAMAVFTRAGLPLDEAVRLSGRVTGASAIASDFAQLAPRLREGYTLAEALAPSKYLSRAAQSYVLTGETTGKLDACFEHLYRELYEAAMFRLRVLVGLIEPLAILGIGLLVLRGLA